VQWAGRQRSSEASLLWLAGLLLVLGVIVYALDRGGSTDFLPAWLTREAGPSIFGFAGKHLPTFVHTLAFILITAAVLWPWPRLLPAICGIWVFIECAFELGQLEPFGERIAGVVPAWFDGVPLLDATPGFFASGTFDPLDILSIGLGAITAYLIVRCLQQGGMQAHIQATTLTGGACCYSYRSPWRRPCRSSRRAAATATARNSKRPRFRRPS